VCRGRVLLGSKDRSDLPNICGTSADWHGDQHKACLCHLSNKDFDDANKVHHTMESRCCTLGLARALYQDHGPNARKYREATFENLRTEVCSTCTEGKKRGQCSNLCCPVGSGRGDEPSKEQQCAKVVSFLAHNVVTPLNEEQLVFLRSLAYGTCVVTD